MNTSFEKISYVPPEYITEKQSMPITPDENDPNEFGLELISRFLNKKTIPIIKYNRNSVSMRQKLGSFQYNPRPKSDGVKV